MNVTLEGDRLHYTCDCGEPAARLRFNGSAWSAWCAACVLGELPSPAELPVHRVGSLSELLAAVVSYWRRRG